MSSAESRTMFTPSSAPMAAKGMIVAPKRAAMRTNSCVEKQRNGGEGRSRSGGMKGMIVAGGHAHKLLRGEEEGVSDSGGGG